MDSGLMTSVKGAFLPAGMPYMYMTWSIMSVRKRRLAGKERSRDMRTDWTCWQIGTADGSFAACQNVRYTVPQKRIIAGPVTLRFRVTKPGVKGPSITVINKGHAELYRKRKLVCTPG